MLFDLQLFAEEAPVTDEVPNKAADEALADPAGVKVDPNKDDKRDNTFSREYVERLRRANSDLEKTIKAAKDVDAERERKSLEDQKKFEELYAATKAELATAKADFMTQLTARDARAVMSEVRAAAASAGIIDASDVKLIDMADFKMSEDGKVDGLDAAIVALKAAKPYLFTNTKATTKKANEDKPLPAGDKTTDGSEKDWTKASDEDFKAAWARLRGTGR